MCVSEGFPNLPFFINEDISRSDGAIRCRPLTTAEAIKVGWRAWRVLRLLVEFGF